MMHPGYALLDVDGVCVMGEEAIPKSAAALGQLSALTTDKTDQKQDAETVNFI